MAGIYHKGYYFTINYLCFKMIEIMTLVTIHDYLKKYLCKVLVTRLVAYS